jgi:hypothetical protein
MESTTTTWEHMNTIMLQTISREYIHNMYELPKIEPTIRYLHAAAGFLVEKMWLKAIQRGNYNFWPLVNITNVAHMQKGHMCNQRQGISFTKNKLLHIFPDTPAIPPHKSNNDIFICIYELKKIMYYDQTGCFPQVFSLGNKFTMVIHNVDRNSLWAEALKDNTGGKPWSKCKRWALSQNTKSWTTKHQWHTRRPLATLI